MTQPFGRSHAASNASPSHAVFNELVGRGAWKTPNPRRWVERISHPAKWPCQPVGNRHGAKYPAPPPFQCYKYDFHSGKSDSFRRQIQRFGYAATGLPWIDSALAAGFCACAVF